MKKYNKLMLHIISISYIILTIIELIKYILIKSNVFGLIYLIICSFIIFLLVPTTVNYRDKKSIARISKLCIVILVGIFCSYFLNKIVINNMNYMDSSIEYNNSIFVIKNVLKPILYVFIIYIIFIDLDVHIFLSNIVKKMIEK